MEISAFEPLEKQLPVVISCPQWPVRVVIQPLLVTMFEYLALAVAASMTLYLVKAVSPMAVQPLAWKHLLVLIADS
jgi:hypothetical protein